MYLRSREVHQSGEEESKSRNGDGQTKNGGRRSLARPPPPPPGHPYYVVHVPARPNFDYLVQSEQHCGTMANPNPPAPPAGAAPTPRPLHFAVGMLGAGQGFDRWVESTTTHGKTITIDQVTDRVANDTGLRGIDGAFLLRVVRADGRVSSKSAKEILAAARDTRTARFLFFATCDDAVAKHEHSFYPVLPMVHVRCCRGPPL